MPEPAAGGPGDASARSLVGALGRWIDRLFPDLARGERLKGALLAGFGTVDRPVSAAACREIEHASHAFSRHLELH